MKNLKKTIAAGLAMAMALSANVGVFADNEFTASYSDDYTKISANLTNQEYFNTTDQYTVIIADKEVADTGSISDAQILYINQGLSTDDFWEEMATKATLVAGKTYLVRIGGENLSMYYEAYVTVESAGEKEITIRWGDVTCDGKVNGSDLTPILNCSAGNGESEYTHTDLGTVKVNNDVSFTLLNATEEGSIRWGDITCDGKVNGSDLTPILNCSAGNGESEYTHSYIGNVKVNNNSTFKIKQ